MAVDGFTGTWDGFRYSKNGTPIAADEFCFDVPFEKIINHETGALESIYRCKYGSSECFGCCDTKEQHIKSMLKVRKLRQSSPHSEKRPLHMKMYDRPEEIGIIDNTALKYAVTDGNTKCIDLTHSAKPVDFPWMAEREDHYAFISHESHIEERERLNNVRIVENHTRKGKFEKKGLWWTISAETGYVVEYTPAEGEFPVIREPDWKDFEDRQREIKFFGKKAIEKKAVYKFGPVETHHKPEKNDFLIS